MLVSLWGHYPVATVFALRAGTDICGFSATVNLVSHFRRNMKSFKPVSGCTLIFILLSWVVLKAQSLKDFKLKDENLYLERGGHNQTDKKAISLSITSVANPVAPNPDVHSKTGLAMRLDWKRYYIEKGGSRRFYQNKSIGDLLYLLGKKTRWSVHRREESSFSTFIGWASWGWNLVAKDRHMFALGFNVNDYAVGATYIYTDTHGNPMTPVTQEPQGLYYGSGPSLFYDYALSEKMILQVHTAYTATFWRPLSLRYAQEDKSYPKPHFFHFNAELQTSFRLFVGFDFSMLINRGNLPNDTRRLDILIGYRF